MFRIRATSRTMRYQSTALESRQRRNRYGTSLCLRCVRVSVSQSSVVEEATAPGPRREEGSIVYHIPPQRDRRTPSPGRGHTSLPADGPLSHDKPLSKGTPPLVARDPTLDSADVPTPVPLGRPDHRYRSPSRPRGRTIGPTGLGRLGDNGWSGRVRDETTLCRTLLSTRNTSPISWGPSCRGGST